MRLRGKFQPAVLFGNNHPEEAFVADELPHIGRQIGAGVGDVPVIQHGTQLLDFVIDKGLFFLAQTALGEGQ
jgi:hypothetical protein